MKLPNLKVFVNSDNTGQEYSSEVCGCCGAQLCFGDNISWIDAYGVDFIINDKPEMTALNERCKMTSLDLGEGVFLHLNTLEVDSEPQEDEDEEW